ncbi:MAG TPA: DUF456 domain-containing protein [Steroidobacteraceae bacterium]
MDPTVLWWTLAIALIVIGVIGTFVPGIPGIVAVFAGMLVAAWIDDFQRIGWFTLVILGVLTALAFVADIVAALIGAKRVGASRYALIGAGLGAVFGIFFGLIGIFILPFIGAVVGEFIAQRRLHHATRVGIATWVGLAVGALAKIALVFAMLAVFAISFFVD